MKDGCHLASQQIESERGRLVMGKGKIKLLLVVCVAPSFLVLVLSLFAGGADVTPTIDKDKIIFLGGKTLPYHSHVVLFSRPEEALKSQSPVSLTEQPVVLGSWQRVVLIRVSNYFEGSTKEIRVYNYKGDLVHPATTVSANSSRPLSDLFFLKATRRIFVGQRSSHHLVEESFLLNDNGGLVKAIPQPETVVGFGVSDDDQLVWIISVDVELDSGPTISKRTVGLLHVFDANGEAVTTRKFYAAGTVRIIYKDKSYSISVKEPELP
jgi:hypothetical protein